ncbi:hypothetical protein [Klebsiella pneumoniae]|uniref:hypothetical protein n=1 Tax=Klebsiella pneumoniae TaxID=573 RepID=UPI00226FFC35|nr:hypothetical protein [Klebsiella pneumoniae]MCY0160086.1 hypothetical protein [Klebsiella pneumoniae]
MPRRPGPRTSSCSIAIADDGTRSPAVATDLELASPHPTMRAGVDHRQVDDGGRPALDLASPFLAIEIHGAAI